MADRPVALVLSSGHNLGAVQVGMLRALVEHGVVVDLVVGCSVGALNGAAFAEEPTLTHVAHLEEVWCTVNRRELMPRRWPSSAMVLARRSEAMQDTDGVRQLVERSLTARTFAELALPFQCVATDVIEASEKWFDRGPLVDAVLASSAMPAVYPTVEIDGRRYLDGALVNDVPVVRAAELGARTIYVLEVGTLSQPWRPPRRPVQTAMQAVLITRRHRFQQALAAVPAGVTVHVLPAGDKPSLGLKDFSQSADLIRVAHHATTAYLDEVDRSKPATRSARSSGRSRPWHAH